MFLNTAITQLQEKADLHDEDFEEKMRDVIFCLYWLKYVWHCLSNKGQLGVYVECPSR